MGNSSMQTPSLITNLICNEKVDFANTMTKTVVDDPDD